jgi:tetratricopeptide (TPR) repeat protein
MDDKKSLKDLLAVKKEVGEEDTGVKALIGEEEKALDSFIEKTKDKLDVNNWLKKARAHEAVNDYQKALESYLKFIEGKLEIISKEPGATLNTYLGMVVFYLKVAECYEKVTHTSAGGKAKDAENAGRYYVKSAEMFIEMEKYDEAQKYYENAARCFAEAENYNLAAGAFMDDAFMNYTKGNKMISTAAFIKAAEFYEKAEDYANSSKAYLKAADLNLDIKDIYGAMSSYNKAAECYDKLNKPTEAIQYYIKSAELASTVERYTEIAERYVAVAKAYEKMQNYQDAVFYHLRAAELNKGNDDLAASYNYDNMARCYVKTNEYDKAIEYLNRSTQMRANIKKYAEASASSYDIAQIYERMGNMEKAASYYFQYAEYGASAKLKEAKDGYGKAAKLFEQMAKKKQEEGKLDKTVEDYLEATKGYDKVGETKISADIYYKMAELEYTRNYDNAIKYYLEAANRYKKIGDDTSAATAFVFAKDYLNAARHYSYFATEQLSKNQFFYAGDGWRKAGDAYRRLKKNWDMKEAYSKAIHDYSQYLQNAEYIKSTDPEMNLGNAEKKIAECFIETEESPKAKEHMDKALAYFSETKDLRQIQAVEALSRIIDADLSLKVGDYEKTYKILNEAIVLLEKAHNEGKWPPEYAEFLEHNKAKAQEIIQKIDVKPEIEMSVEMPKEAMGIGVIKLRGKITNKSKYKINNVFFLPNLPYELSLTKEFEEIPEMSPGDTREFVIEAKTDLAKTYNFAPMEVLYKDKDGNRYMKASNEILLEIK